MRTTQENPSPTPDPEPSTPEPTDPQPAPYKEPSHYTVDVIATAFSGLGYALSARAILAAAVVGGFVLAVMAMGRPGWFTLATLIAYAALVIAPCAWLEHARRES